MKIKMLIESYELCEYGLTGNEVDILVDYADYPMELFADDGGLLDIHAGAFETAAMKSFYKDILDEEMVKNLPDYSLNLIVLISRTLFMSKFLKIVKYTQNRTYRYQGLTAL
jgi:hypothetical protein